MDYGNNENRFNSNRSYGGGNRGGEDGGGYRSNFSASERSVIQIPGTHIGKIIGPAGRHINDLQRQYNVRIQINKMVSESMTRVGRERKFTKHFSVFRLTATERKMPKSLATTRTTFRTQSRQSMNRLMLRSSADQEAEEAVTVDPETTTDNGATEVAADREMVGTDLAAMTVTLTDKSSLRLLINKLSFSQVTEATAIAVAAFHVAAMKTK